MGFVAWTFLSFLHSKTANYGFDEVLQTGSLALIFTWVVRRGSSDQTFFERMVYAVTIATIAAGVIGAFVYILQPVNRFVGTFFDFRFHTDYWPNAWAQYLLLAWPMVTLWALGKTEHRSLRLIILGVVFGWLALSYSRGALIASAGQLVLWGAIFIISRKSMKDWAEYAKRIAIVALTASFVFSITNQMRASVFDVQSVSEKVTFTASEGSSSVSERRDFWEQAIDLSFEEPLFGWGPYSFRFVQPRLQTSVLATSDHPHNVFLKYAMERGWIAVILFAGFLGLILLGFTKQDLRTRRANPLIFPFLSVVGVTAHNLIDYNLQFVGVALLFWVLLAFIARSVKWETSCLPVAFVRFVEVALASVLLILAVIEGKGLVLSSFGRHAEGRGDNAEALEWYAAAEDQWFSRDMGLSRAQILIKQSGFMQGSKALEEFKKMNAEDYRVWKLEGDLSALQGRSEEALIAYQTAYLLGGRYNDISLAHDIVRMHIALDDQAAIDGRKTEFVNLLKTFADAVQTNAHFIALSGNVESTIAFANTLASVYPKEEAQFTVIAAKVDHHAGIEREKLSARPPGFLW
jgi:O-antigen ligase